MTWQCAVVKVSDHAYLSCGSGGLFYCFFLFIFIVIIALAIVLIVVIVHIMQY